MCETQRINSYIKNDIRILNLFIPSEKIYNFIRNKPHKTPP